MTDTVSPPLPCDIKLPQAIAHHAAGRLAEAEQLYRAILQVQPEQPDANHNLGVLMVQAGQQAIGLQHLKTALESDPSQGQYWLSYADALLASGQAMEALIVIQTAIQSGLDTPEAQALLQKAGAAGEPAKQGKPKKKLTASASSQATPTPAELNQLAALLKAGRHAELEAQARLLVKRYPDAGFIWMLLGASLQTQGKDALSVLQRTAKLLPENAEAHNNLGNALLDVKQFDGAAASYRRTLELNPDYAEAHFNLGNALKAIEQPEGAVASYRRALEIKPDYAEVHSNLGNTLLDIGQSDGAVASYRRALEIKPDFAEAHYNLGIALQGLGQLDGALKSYQRALEIKPDLVEALNNLASLLNTKNEPMLALDIIEQSMQVKETLKAKCFFVDCVKRLRFENDAAPVRNNLMRALSENWGRPGDLEKTSTAFIKLNRDIAECMARAMKAWPQRLKAQDLFGPTGLAAFAADPLLHALLCATPISDMEMERFLTMTRQVMLDTAIEATAPNGGDSVALGFFAALAQQCFVNEYVYACTEGEIDRAQTLRDSLAASLEANAQISALWPVAIAAYFPLYSLPLANRLLDRQWPDAVAAMLVQQIREPEEERQCRTTMSRLTGIEDEVSLLVQNQYEENPYPRWTKAMPTDKPITIDKSLHRRFPLARFQPLGKSSNLDVLIAGCGTGQHSNETAQQFQGAQVLAVDLSISSLCYAKRKTRELGLTSIEYAQADLLKLGSFSRRFDVIESCGVLHHIADPWAGWRVLLSLLRPGGFMKLGFYSKVARRNIVQIRTFIAERGYGSTVNEIRRCRQDLMDLDKSAGFGDTLKISDFFSISACRDLLFHVQEHRMTLLDIDAFLRDNHLQFLGFDIDAQVLQSYRLRFPDDPAAVNLVYWQAFENDNPDTFLSMYQFWVQKEVAHPQAGREEEAEQGYRAILQTQPEQADANHNLGVMLAQTGRHAAGLPYLKAALESDPSQGQYWLSYADALLASGQAMEALIVIQTSGLDTQEAKTLLQKAEAATQPQTKSDATSPAKLQEDEKVAAENGKSSKQGKSPKKLTASASSHIAPTSTELNQITALLKAGRHAELETRTHLLVKRYPDAGFIWMLLGASLQSQGKDALPVLQRAAALLPGNIEVHNNLGHALQAIGQLDGAAASYRRVLEIKPDSADAHFNLGNVLYKLGQLDGAAASYRRALEIKPGYAKAHCNLGSSLQGLGQLDNAIASYRRALEIKPDYADAYLNLGVISCKLGQLDDAVTHYHRALEIKPDYADAHCNMGIALQKLGQLNDAVLSYRRALEISPHLVVAHCNLGSSLQGLGQLDGAVASYRRALEIKPDFAEAHNNLGGALREYGQIEDAVASCRRALALKPDYAEAHVNLGNALKDLGQIDDAIASYRRAIEIKPDYAEALSGLLFLYSYHALIDPREYLVQARNWEHACLLAQDRQAARHRVFQRAPLAGRRLKVGYVSGDYWQHAVSYFIEQLFAQHDRARIELFAYSTQGKRDAVTDRLQALVDHWVPLTGIPDAAVRKQIEADGIDVLIDLSGHTARNRLGIFAHRAAPVQAHYLGYFASTGLTEMDYWIGDETLTPAGTDSHFSEQVWCLPRVWVSYDGKADAPIPDWCPSQDGTVWLGSFNNLGKLTPATTALWAKVLHALPEGKLLLKTRELSDVGNRQRILGAMSAHGILPDCIELQDRNATPDWFAHMAYYDRLDIALDPVGGVGGGTTTCDALWMGVPTITLEGDRMASRMTASMLNAIGHPEWIARSEAEYIDKIVALARAVEQRKALRSGQRARMASSPLCDAKNLVMNLENTYFEMFERWLKKNLDAKN